jgi:hypothetical protein
MVDSSGRIRPLESAQDRTELRDLLSDSHPAAELDGDIGPLASDPAGWLVPRRGGIAAPGRDRHERF